MTEVQDTSSVLDVVVDDAVSIISSGIHGGTIDDDVVSWFTNDDGHCSLNDLPTSLEVIGLDSVETHESSLTRTLTSLSRLSTSSSVSQRSGLSNNTVLPVGGTRRVSLADLCDLVEETESLQTAKIISCSTYVKKGGISHRFVVLGLSRPHRKAIFLRIDRRPTSRLELFGGVGVTRSNDEAILASELSALVDVGCELECLQAFPSNKANLDFLNDYLRLFWREVPRYKIYSENCWTLASFVQGILNDVGDGHFVRGKIVHAEFASKIRQRIDEKFKSVCRINIPQSMLAVLGGLRLRNGLTRQAKKTLSETLSCLQDWKSRLGVVIRQRDVAMGVLRMFRGVLFLLFTLQCDIELRILCTTSTRLLHALYVIERENFESLHEQPRDNDATPLSTVAQYRRLTTEHSEHSNNLYRDSCDFGKELYNIRLFEEAAEIYAQADDLSCRLLSHRLGDPLSLSLHLIYYGYSLLKIDSSEKASDVLCQAAVKYSQTPSLKNVEESQELVKSLLLCAEPLGMMGLHHQAANTLVEAVALALHLHSQYSLAIHEDLLDKLTSFSRDLIDSKFYEEASGVLEGAVKLQHCFDPTKLDRDDELELARTLTHYGEVLCKIHSYNKAEHFLIKAIHVYRNIAHAAPSDPLAAAFTIPEDTLLNLDFNESSASLEEVPNPRSLLHNHQTNPVSLKIIASCGQALYWLESYEPARPVLLEAINRHRQLHAQDTLANSESFSILLAMYGRVLISKDYSRREASKVFAEAVHIQRHLRLHHSDPQEHRRRYIFMLDLYGRTQSRSFVPGGPHETLDEEDEVRQLLDLGEFNEKAFGLLEDMCDHANTVKWEMGVGGWGVLSEAALLARCLPTTAEYRRVLIPAVLRLCDSRYSAHTPRDSDFPRMVLGQVVDTVRVSGGPDQGLWELYADVLYNTESYQKAKEILAEIGR